MNVEQKTLMQKTLLQKIGGRVIRLTLDINLFVADTLAKRHGRRGTSASMLVDAIRQGACPAGPVQLVTSVPIIENYASLLRRHFGYTKYEAEEKAWLLERYVLDGAMPEYPRLAVGSGHVAFETEDQMRAAMATFAVSPDAEKLFDEVKDDRYVLETALAGRADILVTSDIDDFTRGPAIKLQREDLVLYPFAGGHLVIAKPSFAAHWLWQGIIPDATFVSEHPDAFRLADAQQ
jgi:hypothetical protein